MKKRIKKKPKQNTNNINGNDLINDTRRPWPMTPKAGVTVERRRRQFGGYVG